MTTVAFFYVMILLFRPLLILLRQLVFPLAVRARKQALVVKVSVAGHLWPEERRTFERLILMLQFHFAEEQSLVVAMKLIYLKDMVAIRHEVTHLGDISSTAEGEHLTCIIEGYLPLELIA